MLSVLCVNVLPPTHQLYNIPIAAATFFVCATTIVAVFSKNSFVKLCCFASIGYAFMTDSSAEQRSIFTRIGALTVNHTVIQVSGIVTSVPVQSYGQYSFTINADSLYTSNCPTYALQEKTIVCFSSQKPPVYGNVSAAGHFIPYVPAENPGGYDSYINNISNNVWGKFYCDTLYSSMNKITVWQRMSAYARSVVFRAVSSIKNPDYKAIVVASFLNDRSDMSNEVKNVFYNAGIYHLLALSGFNIAIFASALFLCLTLIPICKEAKVITVILIIWLYLIFIGMIPSLFRAAVMSTIILSSYLFQKKPYTLNTLGLAGCVWLAFSPLSLFTAGYQLSFAATAGLILLYPVLTKQISFNNSKHVLLPKIGKPLLSAILLSLSAFIATLPVLAWQFGTLQLAGMISNLFAITLMSVAMWISLAGFVLQIIIPVLVPFCMWCAEFVIDSMIRLATVTATLPFAAVKVPYIHPLIYFILICYLIGLSCVNDKLFRRFAAWGVVVFLILSAVITIISQHTRKPELTSFYIKKTNLTALRLPNGHAWLFGLGPEDAAFSTYNRVIAPWMRKSFVNNIDAVVISGDYCNATQSIEPLLKNCHVKKVMAFDSCGLRCPVFKLFLDEYKCALIGGLLHQQLLADCNCTCSVSSLDSVNIPCFDIKLFNNKIILPQSLLLTKESTGSITLGYNQSRVAYSRHNISPYHPEIPCLDTNATTKR